MSILSPLAQKQWQKFKSIRRGYWSAIILITLLLLSFVAEIFVNSRAIIVYYEGEIFLPTYGKVIPGKTFGLDYDYETNYRELDKVFKSQKEGSNWVLMPIVPFNQYENHLIEGDYPPYAPSAEHQHYLGTDSAGRDIVARLIYGFRVSMLFALILLFFEYVIGATIGCLMGYFGGKFDLFFQRIIEVWSNIPTLYVIIIVASIIVPSFWTLILIMVCFGWVGMTWYMRTATYREISREYVMAARALGAKPSRVIFKHILPNSISILVTFIPFTIAGGISSLTALDYLGFGLPAPTPSWGELLRQGVDNFESPWILTSVCAALILVLIMVTFVGEAIREAFDAKRYSIYR